MAQTVLITLTTVGADTGPSYDLYAIDANGAYTLFDSNRTIVGSYTATNVPDNAVAIDLHSRGACSTILRVQIAQPTPTPYAVYRVVSNSPCWNQSISAFVSLPTTYTSGQIISTTDGYCWVVDAQSTNAATRQWNSDYQNLQTCNLVVPCPPDTRVDAVRSTLRCVTPEVDGPMYYLKLNGSQILFVSNGSVPVNGSIINYYDRTTNPAINPGNNVTVQIANSDIEVSLVIKQYNMTTQDLIGTLVSTRVAANQSYSYTIVVDANILYDVVATY